MVSPWILTHIAAMNDNIGNPAGIQRPHPPGPFGNAFYGTGSGIIRGGLGAYGERFLGSSSEFMQSNVGACGNSLQFFFKCLFSCINWHKYCPIELCIHPHEQISQHLSDSQYYFQVNGQYVRNKLKVILLPFLHRGHWTRITEPVGGRLSYKPPVHDINAPDLYIPFMAFGTYVVLAGFMLGVLGSGEAPLLDVVAYTGYAFTGMSVAVFARIFWNYSYYFLLPWICVCMGIFLVKTMKRVLLGGTRSYEKHTNRHHYLLLFMAAAQFPWFFWLGNVGA
ncbi:Yif1 family protein [Dioscorea alata]|uniref:Yif1 family protein n=1 Tax=Dioscorea alata TaxID=55571 RepID=A0ACB7U0V1_DIOAL|nr:Yif1 family protein [Dioscorea alata]